MLSPARPCRTRTSLGTPRIRSPTRPHTYRLPHSPAWFPTNVARNSPTRLSNFEIGSLQFQRFQGISKTDRGKLRASFRGGSRSPCRRGRGWPGRCTHSYGPRTPDHPSQTTHPQPDAPAHLPPARSSCRLPALPAACPRDRRTPAWFPTNVARNSPNHPSNFEIRSLQFQRFQGISKTDQGKLRATFGGEYVPANAVRPGCLPTSRGPPHPGAAPNLVLAPPTIPVRSRLKPCMACA